jgi:hypothetical protein
MPRNALHRAPPPGRHERSYANRAYRIPAIQNAWRLPGNRRQASRAGNTHGELRIPARRLGAQTYLGTAQIGLAWGRRNLPAP